MSYTGKSGWHAAPIERTAHIVDRACQLARHPHQVIRIVKEQDSSNDEFPGHKKTPVAKEPTGVLFSLVGRPNTDSLPTHCSQGYLINSPVASLDPSLSWGRAKP